MMNMINIPKLFEVPKRRWGMASYKVIFLGLSVIGLEEETRLLEGLQKKFNLTPEKAESLLQRVPIVVKKGLAKGEEVCESL